MNLEVMTLVIQAERNRPPSEGERDRLRAELAFEANRSGPCPAGRLRKGLGITLVRLGSWIEGPVSNEPVNDPVLQTR